MRSMVAVGVVALMLAATPGFAQTPPPQTPPPAQQPPAQPPAQVAPPLTFGSDAAILFNTIKADKTADFEAVMAKLKEALQKGNDQRKQQAASWKVFKSVEPVQGNTLYLFIVDPPIKDADYTVSKVLAEAFPYAEAMDLYKKYSEAYVGGRNLMNLQLIQNFATPGAPAPPGAAPPQ